MKLFDWDEEKNSELRKIRGISFEDVLFYLEKGEILDIVENPKQDKYPGQKIFILEINEYIYYVPFAEDEKKVYLKTIIPSRKYTRKYLGGKKDER
jgi:uncharacterized DUF497 family protein